MDLSGYEFRTQPWFEASQFQGFDDAIPMKTLVVHCFDPRAADIPNAVAKHLPGEVYPGEDIRDDAGNKVGSTRTLFTLSNGGGRAVDALLAIATLDYLFRLQKRRRGAPLLLRRIGVHSGAVDRSVQGALRHRPYGIL
jgi:carbonic anhydrase